MNNRVWTDEQLAEMSKRTIEKVIDAINEGDKERAKELAKLMYDQFAFVHDGYMSWVTGLLTYIYEHHGIKEVEAAERAAHAKEGKLVFKPPKQTDFKFMVEKLAAELQAHVHQVMTLEEDDEKVVLTNTPCGSGGRLIQMGAYESEIGMAHVKEPRDITFNTGDYPIYCTHCALFNMNAVDDLGDFIFLNNPPQKDGSYCQFIFYKDKSKIPDEYYTRLGRQNPHRVKRTAAEQ
jgi:hypothetical protein